MLEREEFLETDSEMMAHGQMIPKEVVSAETNMERRRASRAGKGQPMWDSAHRGFFSL